MRIAAALLSLIMLVSRSHAASPPQQAQVVIENDIEYARPEGTPLQLNLARPAAGSGPFPAVVFIHGGGFRAGTRQGYDGLIRRLAEHGFVAVTVTYRLAPRHPFPAAVHDVKSAVRWLRKNAEKYHIDPDRIGATGASAGGTLAQLLGVTEGVSMLEGEENPGYRSEVQCVVNVYGANDFTQSYGKSVDAHEVLPLWLGGDLKTQRRRHIEASPLYWVTPTAAPTLILHGTKDNYVAYEQAVWLYDKMKATACDVELITFEGAGHGFRGDDAKRADDALIAYFEKKLKPRH
jgi:acetyl esterase/lipase